MKDIVIDLQVQFLILPAFSLAHTDREEQASPRHPRGRPELCLGQQPPGAASLHPGGRLLQQPQQDGQAEESQRGRAAQ